MAGALDKVREKYPQFNAMTDAELADSLFNSHYANKMTKEDYYQRLGMDMPREGWSGVASDIGNSFTNLIPSAINTAKALPSELIGAAKQAITDPARLSVNALSGASEGVEGLLNTPSNIASYLKSKGIGKGALEDAIVKLRVPSSNVRDLLGKSKEGDALISGIASFLPYGKIGAASQGLKGLATRAGAAGAWGVGQNEDPIQAALLSFLAEKGVSALGNLPNARPSKFLRGNLSPQQLEANLRATAGTETGLGDVLGNPKLKQFIENQAASFPYSGADSAMARTAQEIHNRSNSLMDDMLSGNRPENIGQALVDSLQKASKEATEIKEQKWKRVNDLADQEGVLTPRKTFVKAARSALNRIKNDPHLAAFRSGEDKALLNTVAESSEGRLFSIKDTDFLRGELGERAFEAYKNNDKPKYNLYKQLKESLEKDIHSAIDDSKSKELKTARDDAMDYHKNEYVDFEDPDIMRFTRRNADPDTFVQYFLRTGRLTDRANLLKKVLDKLPPGSKELLPYAYLSNAIEGGKVNPNKLRTLYKNLGEKQKAALFPDQARKRAFEDHINLVGKNQEALSLMANPKTGWRVGNALQNVIQVLGAVLGGAHGHVPGAILGGAAAHFIPGMAYRPAVKLLTNPTFREALVKKMLKQEKSRNIPREEMINRLIEQSGQGARAATIPLSTTEGNE